MQRDVYHKQAYVLHRQALTPVTEAKYLGVTLSSDLKWNTHITEVAAKANQTLGFVRRNLKISSPVIKTRVYAGLVRPKLEYAASVWDPHTATNVYKLEKVQRRAARWTLNRYHNTSSVTGMLEHLDWRSLQHRRVDARLCLFYKMVHGLVAVSPLSVAWPITRTSRRHHDE